MAELRSLIGGRTPTIVAVHAEEAAGRNAIPQTYAKALSEELGLAYDRDIVQANSPQRTGKSALYRLQNRPTFEGPVEAGRDYLIADDHVSQGGTLADLEAHIERDGANVIAATSLTGSHTGPMLRREQRRLMRYAPGFLILKTSGGEVRPWLLKPHRHRRQISPPVQLG